MYKRHLRWLWITLLSLTVLAVLGSVGATIYAARLPSHTPDQETLIYGQNQLAPGSQAALRVIVREVGDASPIAGAQVRVWLKPKTGDAVFEGVTDAHGTAEVALPIPADADPQSILVVETRSPQGRERVEREVTITRDYKVLLSTDKPIYQPGQVIHIRALALGAFDLVPAVEQPLELTIHDAKGNAVFRRTLTTSEHGVTSVDFQLANEVNTSNYKLTATLGNSTSELTVVVKHYVLPKFKVDAAADSPFYLPGEHVTGAVDVNYFFGKPVDEGQVVLTGYTFDVQLNEVFRIEGQTDADGHYDFAFDLPDYFVGGGLEDQLATFVVEVAVTDGAEHTERIHLNLPVARERLLIEAVPESGDLVPGVENIVYIVTATPDGTPVPAELTIWAEGQTFTAASGDYGLAEWRFTPSEPWQEVKITARDAQGHEATRVIYFEAQGYSPVLLRPERAIARVGDTLHLDIFSPVGTGSLYLDIIREGQTVSTRALKPANGHAQADIDLTPDLYGTLELHAYTISQWGEIQRDSRLVIVDAPRDLDIAIHADADTYLPGATAALDFDITGQDGAGVPSVLGVAVVDESVFALQEQDPGFLKLYFLLEKELMEPKYDIHGFTLPDAVLYPEETSAARTAQDEAAQASLAGTTVGGGHSLAVNTHDEGVRRLEERQNATLRTVGRVLAPLTLLLPLAIAALAVSELRRERVLGRSLLLVVALSVSFIVLLARLPLPDWIGRNLLERLGYLFDEFSYSELGPGMLAMSILLGICAWIALVIRAIRRKEAVRGTALGLMLLYFVALLLLLFLGPQLAFNPPEWAAILLVLTVFLPPLACLVWATGEAWQRRPWPALGTFALVGLTLGLPLFGLQGLSDVGAHTLGVQQMGLDAPGRGWANEGDVMVEEALPMNGFMVAVPTEAPVEKSAEAPAPVAGAEPSPAQPQAPRLRQLFGETMAWLPELVTNDTGELHVDLPLYDNITTWRLTALAHSQDGRLGATTTGLRVFQDFFVDFDLPYAMTQHDEVALPVAVYNYLEQPQSVRLVLEEEPWFELLDEPEKTLLIGSHDVEVVRFRIRVTATQGRYRPIVWAYGERMSDATTATHDVLITPDGKPFESTWSDRLGPEVLHTVRIPDAIIPGTTQVEVKVYPGIVSQLVEGMDTILQMPYGCFEQTTSATYPNALALDYMQTTGQTAPEVQLKAEQYLNLGYQRLTTFEVPGGGFSLFGDNPPDRMLTAYGLMEFTDMARVFPVDADFIARAARWLIAQQDSDGSWENDRGLVHENTWQNLGNDRVPVTAYLSWALIHAGYGDEAATQSGLTYVREHAHQVEDPYALALVANALVAGDPGADFTQQTLERLAALATVEGDAAWWQSDIATMMGSQGQTNSVETTALAAYAFQVAGTHSDLANKSLTYLIQQKDPQGTWYSTQATILALKALLLSVTGGGEQAAATVTVTFDGGRARTVEVTPENYDVVHILTFDDVTPGAHDVRLSVETAGGEDAPSLMAQVTTRYYLPWSDTLHIEPGQGPLDIAVAYDRTALAVDDVVQVKVTVTLNEPGTVDWALVDLGIPPGFTVMPEGLQARIAHDSDLPEDAVVGRVKKFELTGRQVLVYLQNLPHGEPLTFTYQLRARFPVKAQVPASQAYDYYNPDTRGEQQPVLLVVEAGD
ncbi:MAG: hypothetical protein DRI37_03145 [Chloroflexi bacterium]|nr:MAG: hypothetical protein DRI37_03145 [Chloroflexota bacterium]